jgi:hypothetical protein
MSILNSFHWVDFGSGDSCAGTVTFSKKREERFDPL